jgi:hypothetical protein
MVIDTRQFIRRRNSGSVKQNPDARARQGRVSEGIRKKLRLQAARSLMLNSGLDAGSSAFEVGYESPTQSAANTADFPGSTAYQGHPCPACQTHRLPSRWSPSKAPEP